MIQRQTLVFKRRARPFSAQRGIEILEFLVALIFIFPFFWLLVNGGLAFINQTSLVEATRAAAREAARGGDLEAQREAARQVLADANLIDPDDELTCADDLTCQFATDPNDPVSIALDYPLLYFARVFDLGSSSQFTDLTQ